MASKALFVACAAYALSSACSSPASGGGDASAAAAEKVRAKGSIALLATGDVGSDTEECGCKARRLGGIARRAQIVKDVERTHPGSTLVVDAGDLFFRTTLISPRDEPQARETASFQADAVRMMHTPAMAVGERDLALGVGALRALAKKAGVTLVSANLVHAKSGTAAFDAFTLVERGGMKIGIVGASLEIEPKAAAHALYVNSGLEARPVEPALEAASRAARAAGADLVVGLLHLGVTRAKEALNKLPAGTIDVAVLAHDRITSNGLELASGAKTALMTTGERGKWLAELDIDVVPGAQGIANVGAVEDAKRSLHDMDERIAQYEHLDAGVIDPAIAAKHEADRQATIDRLKRRREQLTKELETLPSLARHRVAAKMIPLDIELVEDQEMLAALNAYKDRLRVVNAGVAPIGHSELTYLGNAGCKTCHAPAFEQWETTKHARAWRTMEETRQIANLDCVPCHTTGFDRPGGPTSIAVLLPFVNVGCESCHGPGSAHAKSPQVKLDYGKNVPERVCAECHRAQADQKAFVFEERLPKIIGPGHGRPVAPAPKHPPQRKKRRAR